MDKDLNGATRDDDDCNSHTVSGHCIGHWHSHKGHSSGPIKLINFQEGQSRDLSFLCAMVTENPDFPGQDYYMFDCYDITLGPSDDEVGWKVEPRVAAQIFEWFLNNYFDLNVTRQGREYYFKAIEQQAKSDFK
jgi:hypothetical protein